MFSGRIRFTSGLPVELPCKLWVEVQIGPKVYSFIIYDSLSFWIESRTNCNIKKGAVRFKSLFSFLLLQLSIILIEQGRKWNDIASFISDYSVNYDSAYAKQQAKTLYNPT